MFPRGAKLSQWCTYQFVMASSVLDLCGASWNCSQPQAPSGGNVPLTAQLVEPLVTAHMASNAATVIKREVLLLLTSHGWTSQHFTRAPRIPKSASLKNCFGGKIWHCSFIQTLPNTLNSRVDKAKIQ
eukprot:6468892-Amphidinium_carterae.5